MATIVEQRLNAIDEILERADGVTNTLSDASKHIGALITACGYLVEIIEAQQRRIEQLYEQ